MGTMEETVGLSRGVVSKLLASQLEAAATWGIRTLVVEDDTARRGDASVRPDAAYVGDRVIRWTDLRDGVEDAVALIRAGSSGYPLICFGSRKTAALLGLAAGREVPGSDLETLAESMNVIVLAALDAETYLVLEAPGAD